MPRGQNATNSQNIRKITPAEWGEYTKEQIVNGKFVLMERVIHRWGSRVVNGVRQLEEDYQRKFFPPDQVEEQEKVHLWYRVEDQFDVDDVLRKEERLLDGEGRDVKKSMKRQKAE